VAPDSDLLIRPYARGDWDRVWTLLEPVFRAGETYAYPRDITEETACLAWTGDPKQVFVAVYQATGGFFGT